ncbi:MAG: ATP-binding protein [Actinomycetota bacterium]
MNPNNNGFQTLELHLPARRESVRVARHALEDLAEIPVAVFEDLKLLVSELVTNSIKHSGLNSADLIELRVKSELGVVRAEVADNGPGFKQEPPPPITARESGWGLFLVEQLSDRWGLSVDGETRVWFELDFQADNVKDGAGPPR